MSFTQFTFDNPTKWLFGSGRLNELHKQNLPGSKALLLISNGKSTRMNGSLDRTIEQLELAGVEHVLFDKIMQNPVREVCMEAAGVAREHGCDFVVALGGGAVLDAATAIAAMATNPGDLWDYVGGTGAGKPIENPCLPVVAITTTAGTSSEINGWAVISNLETNEKLPFGDDSFAPVLAIVDPQLMVSIPATYTAYQGFDAFFHHAEGMICAGRNILAQSIALDAIKNICAYLPAAVEDGTNLEAREHIAYASTMAGMTMQLAGCCGEHAMEHAMSAYHPNLAHGAGLIMISHEFFKFFIDRGVCSDEFVAMARVMGRPDAADPQEFLEALHDLMVACKVDTLSMLDYGFAPDEGKVLAASTVAMAPGMFANNPCEMTLEECAAIFDRSCK